MTQLLFRDTQYNFYANFVVKKSVLCVRLHYEDILTKI